MDGESTILRLRVDTRLKTEFVDAVQREQSTPSRVLRRLIEEFVADSRRREAERQSRIVAQSGDRDGTMEEVARAQDWLRE